MIFQTIFKTIDYFLNVKFFFRKIRIKTKREVILEMQKLVKKANSIQFFDI